MYITYPLYVRETFIYTPYACIMIMCGEFFKLVKLLLTSVYGLVMHRHLLKWFDIVSF